MSDDVSNYLGFRPGVRRLLRNGKPKRLCSLEIDHPLKRRGLLDGEVSRLRALQDFVHIRAGATVQIFRCEPYDIKPPSSANSLVQ